MGLCREGAGYTVCDHQPREDGQGSWSRGRCPGNHINEQKKKRLRRNLEESHHLQQRIHDSEEEELSPSVDSQKRMETHQASDGAANEINQEIGSSLGLCLILILIACYLVMC